MPEALSRFYLDDPGREHGPESPVGASWMTREGRLAEIDDYVAYLDSVYRDVRSRLTAQPDRVCVLGYSQGAATASRWVALGETPVNRLVLWGGLLPPDLDLEAAKPRLQSVDLTLVAGSRDRYANAQRLASQLALLARQGIPARQVAFDGGHRLDSDLLRAVAAGSPG